MCQSIKFSKRDITYSILVSISYVLFSLTLGITFILFFRPFFFSQISYLSLVEKCPGKTYLDLKNCYNSLMDSLIFYEGFSLGGVFEYSEEGMNHFLSCRPLFLLNNLVFLFTSLILIINSIIKKIKPYNEVKFKSISLKTYLFLIPIIIIIIGIIWGLIDFYSLFTLFHKIMFPGATNWLFDPLTDPIINMFQEAFFINCAILIVVVFILLGLLSLYKDIKLILIRKKN